MSRVSTSSTDGRTTSTDGRTTSTDGRTTSSDGRSTSTDAGQWTIGQLAERSGAAPSAIRFYESQGLLTSSRTAGNQRRYPRATLRRLGFIRAAQRVGLSLEEIRDALATLPDERTPTKRDWERLSRHWRRRLDDQIERLERLRDRLDGCIGCGCLSLRACRLSNPGDALADEGPGAVRLEPGEGGSPGGDALP